MLMKKSSDIIGNRTLGLPVCSAMPQPLRQEEDDSELILGNVLPFMGNE
jgi:hypothetical protein